MKKTPISIEEQTCGAFCKIKLKNPLIFIIVVFFISCSETDKQKMTRLVKEWEGKEIKFPDNIIHTIYGSDTIIYQIPQTNYIIVSYIDSVGCTSCKLQMQKWKEYIGQLDSILPGKISFKFIFHPKDKKELSYLLKRDGFDFPVWIDNDGTFNKINNLPENRAFHTLLLDNFYRVMVIGDPMSNPKIKELYQKIIFNKDADTENKLTTVEISKHGIDFGKFDWRIEQKDTFKLYNVGNNMLIINDIVTSCGCLKVQYSKEPVKPGKTLDLVIVYKADNPEVVNKSVRVYTNIKISPLEFKIMGISN